MTLIGIAGEDEGHFRIATTLIDDALLGNLRWLHGVLESCRGWCGFEAHERWSKYRSEDAYDLRPMQRGTRTFRPQGWIGGEPLKPEAGMWRRVLWRFQERDPLPDIVSTTIGATACAPSACHARERGTTPRRLRCSVTDAAPTLTSASISAPSCSRTARRNPRRGIASC